VFYDSSYYVTRRSVGGVFVRFDAPLEEVIMHREDVLLEDIDIFKDYLVVSERTNGLNRIRIMP
jgi:protease II